MVLFAQGNDVASQLTPILSWSSSGRCTQEELRPAPAPDRLAEVTFHGVDRMDRVTKAGGNLPCGDSFDAQCPQDLVVSVEAPLRLQEEASELVHGK